MGSLETASSQWAFLPCFFFIMDNALCKQSKTNIIPVTVLVLYVTGKKMYQPISFQVFDFDDECKEVVFVQLFEINFVIS